MRPPQPAQTRSSKGASTSLARIMTVAQRLASIPNTPEIGFAIRVCSSLHPSSQPPRPTSLGEDQNPETRPRTGGNKIMPKPAAKPTVATESLKQDRVSRLRLPIRRAYGRFGGFLEWAIRVAAHPHEHGPERPVLLAVDQDSARYVFAVRSRRRAVSTSSPAPCQSFAQASRTLMVARWS